MLRFAVLLVAVAFPNFASAGDLLLRIDVVACRNIDFKELGKEPVKESDQTLLSSLEIMVQPGTHFRGRARIGNSTLAVRGVCRQEEKPNEFYFDLRAENYDHADDKEIVNRRSVHTMIAVKLGQPVIVGGFGHDVDGVKSATLFKVSIIDPATDDES
ncbi:MAG: hypothetical protein ACM3U2_23755 [Deltaproteobacteria bacterium]